MHNINLPISSSILIYIYIYIYFIWLAQKARKDKKEGRLCEEKRDQKWTINDRCECNSIVLCIKGFVFSWSLVSAFAGCLRWSEFLQDRNRKPAETDGLWIGSVIPLFLLRGEDVVAVVPRLLTMLPPPTRKKAPTTDISHSKQKYVFIPLHTIYVHTAQSSYTYKFLSSCRITFSCVFDSESAC